MVSKCKITGLPMLNDPKGVDSMCYDVNFQDERLEFRFSKKCYDNPEIANYAHIIVSLFLNKKVYKTGLEILHWDYNEDSDTQINLQKLIKTAVYPRTPKEKQENLFKELFKLQDYDGHSVSLTDFFTPKRALTFYFKNENDLKAMLNH